MKIIKTVWIRGYKRRDLLERDLRTAAIDPNSGEWNSGLGIFGWSGSFDIGDSRWSKLCAMAKRSGIDPMVGERIEYSKAEVSNAEVLELHCAVERKGDTGPEYGNQYDFDNACPLCLSGARLVAPFRMAEKDLPKRKPIAETHAGEILVSGDLLAILSSLPKSDQWLVNVEDQQTRRSLPWKVIQPMVGISRWDPSTRGMKQEHGLGFPWDACSRCGQDCHGPKIGEAVQLIYKKDSVPRMPNREMYDTMRTWELMGPGTREVANAKRQVAQPYILVSQKVARLIATHAKDLAILTPVLLL